MDKPAISWLEKSVENVKEQTAVSQEPAEFSIKTIILPLLAIIVGMIMVILDSTVVNVAIPNLVQYFETDLKTIQWTVTGYTWLCLRLFHWQAG